MDLSKMLLDLRAEHEQITSAIRTLEALSYGVGRRRGRPPKWLEAVRTEQPIRKRRRRLSEKGRAAISAAAKKRWAEARKHKSATQ
jgi:hypothetical protein